MALDISQLVKKVKKSQRKKKEKEEKERREEAEKMYRMPPPPRREGEVSEEEAEGERAYRGYRRRPEEDESDESEEKDDDFELENTRKRKIKLIKDKEPGEWIQEKTLVNEGEEEKEDIDVSYPLIPSEPENNERVFASAHITYDERGDSLVYRVSEPELSPQNEEILERVENILKEKIDVNFDQLERDEAEDYMRKKVREILDSRNFGITRDDKEVIEYYAYRNFVGLGKLEPIMNDKNVEDISCDGVNIPVYVYHRNPDISSVKSNVYWESDDEMDSFVRKLAQRCGKSISMASPLLDGALPDGSRVQATLGTDIARRGTNFTIRRFTDEPLTPVHLMESGSIDARMLAYLWICVENGKSMLISGATASGKTTLLNALSLFIRPELKVVSIEDTPELRLPHPNWVPEVSRGGFGSGESSTGEVTMDDLLRESLRQRPDYIIVGEVRGEEAYVLFQQIATGHPGMSTIHASNIQKVMDRLTTKPIDLPPSLIENLDLIVFPKRTRRQGTYVRRVGSIYEFEKYDKDEERPVVNRVFKWDAKEDVFRNENDSFLLNEIVDDHGIEPDEIQEEMLRRKKILQWMKRKGIKHYEKVGEIISTFYTDPQKILRRVQDEL